MSERDILKLDDERAHVVSQNVTWLLALTRQDELKRVCVWLRTIGRVELAQRLEEQEHYE